MYLEGIEVKVFCDLWKENIECVEYILWEFGCFEVENYLEEGMWCKMCECKEIDFIYICMDWLIYIDIVVYVLQQGCYVVLEVFVVMSVVDCWCLVDIVEEICCYCMMLENCCYDVFVLIILNMVQQGVLGEIIYVEGVYIYDLCKYYFVDEKVGGYYNYWIKFYSQQYMGNFYFIYGLGFVC